MLKFFWIFIIILGKINYLKRVFFSQFQTHFCPCCNNKEYNLIDSKYFGITKLLECKSCKLRYRTPQDSKEYNFKFYQFSYVQKGLTTELPEDEELQKVFVVLLDGDDAEEYAYDISGMQFNLINKDRILYSSNIFYRIT